tara:strand:+ start:2784 stop:2924 length:141 start_codon:yes stop_codon:yes gene_type:complete
MLSDDAGSAYKRKPATPMLVSDKKESPKKKRHFGLKKTFLNASSLQ